MRDGNEEKIEPFRVFLWYLWNAIRNLNAKPRIVYRGLFNVNPAAILGEYKDRIVWPAFSSTTFDRKVFINSSYTLNLKGFV